MNIPVDYQNKVLKERHFEAYDYWILIKGDERAFEDWYSSNTEKGDSFVKWFVDNGIEVVDNLNKFYSGQYLEKFTVKITTPEKRKYEIQSER
ncbi:MAG TPA: hypothetical protein PK548_00245 [Bacteroidales bacterium]|nr:hypothetical protein [Bacteroidales bacterium]HQA86675.1 hypothetical protein [Bacteroidales bacterium]